MRPIARWLVPEALAAAAALWLTAGPAAAQNGPFRRGDPPCVLDKCLTGGATTTRPKHPDGPATPDGPSPESGPSAPPGNSGFRAGVAPGPYDFYVLALSWSPGFCETGGAEKARRQCEPGSGFGFVVHGLWPQNARGYPSDCNSSAAGPTRMALDSVRGVYPDEGLARHEWRMHGTCTGLSPTAYFAEVRRARAAIVIPEAFRAPENQRSWLPLDIARAFATANPGLRPDSMAIGCRSDTLEEVRICLNKDLRSFVVCPEVARASCRRPVEVPPVL